MTHRACPPSSRSRFVLQPPQANQSNGRARLKRRKTERQRFLNVSGTQTQRPPLRREVDHPGIGMPKSFASDVKVVEDGNERALKISMNEPLRAEGLVVYQASWGPSTARPGDPLFSTFAVVRNPADQYPLYSCIVIAIGLVLHFARKLIKHVKVEGQRS